MLIPYDWCPCERKLESTQALRKDDVKMGAKDIEANSEPRSTASEKSLTPNFQHPKLKKNFGGSPFLW